VSGPQQRGEFAALPLSFLRRITIAQCSINHTGARKECHVPLIEDREVQQLYDGIVRQTERALRPQRWNRPGHRKWVSSASR
jgi:hypothetical protein